MATPLGTRPAGFAPSDLCVGMIAHFERDRGTCVILGDGSALRLYSICFFDERLVMDKARTAVSIRLSLIDELRAVVSREQSPVGRLFDSKRSSRAKIVEAALEVAAWFVSGGMGKQLVDTFAPEFQQRLYETDRNAFMRGAQATATFLGAELTIDAVRGIITVRPPAALENIGPGEIDPKPLVEPKTPTFH